MSRRFFDEPLCNDCDADCEDNKNGGISPEAQYNDYRNRMPFHYVEDGRSDGYYYWQFGQTMEIEFTLEDNISYTDGVANAYFPISEYFKDSETKKIQFVLRDFRGNEVEVQDVKASELKYEEDVVKAYFRVNDKLSAILHPNTYKLYINIVDEVLDETGETLEIIYNKCLTENGIEIRIRG